MSHFSGAYLVLPLISGLLMMIFQQELCSLEDPSMNTILKNPMRKWPTLLQKLRSRTPDTVQAITVQGMITRLLPGNRSSLFIVHVNSSLTENGRDVFVLEGHADGRRLQVTGSTGVAAAFGFHYYAKTFCGCHFSWSGDQVMTLPDHDLPLPEVRVKVVTNDPVRYYQNACTSSYSSVWWTWSRWEREIDWMALNAINLPLAFTGHEAILRRVYLSLGFSDKDLDGFFVGPAFLAWNRMGGIDGWAGPISLKWHRSQLELQHRILLRMRHFGMVAVLPAFTGHVPRTIQNYFPNVKVTRLPAWGHFNDTPFSCTYLLDHSNPLFQTIGTLVMNETRDEFGLDGHVYASDTFNELPPPTTTTSDMSEFVAGVGRAVYRAMASVDPDAVWLMQGWLFLEPFWNETMARALLTSVPAGRMIVLDLQAELRPQYGRLDSFYGQYWIWCMLHNFGGVKGLYGAVSKITSGPFLGRSFPNSTMLGTGIAPEGIEQNDVVYELMNEMAYLRHPIVDFDAWASLFATRRYGVHDQNVTVAWQILLETVYDCNDTAYTSGFHGRFIPTRRPSLELVPNLCYDPLAFLTAWDQMVVGASSEAVRSSDLFRHDLVDVSREALVGYASQFYGKVMAAFDNRNSTHFNESSESFLSLLDDLEVLLASDSRFLLGPWLESAKNLSSTESESMLYEYNARNQITLWGPRGELLDYATKQWSGIVSSYYAPRWRLFIDTVRRDLQFNETFNQMAFNFEVFAKVEKPFTLDRSPFATDPIGDPVRIATALHTKWRQP